jgi:hypothetical protein
VDLLTALQKMMARGPYTWEVQNFADEHEELLSPPALVGGHSRKLILYPNGNPMFENTVAAYVTSEGIATKPPGLQIALRAKLLLVNHADA